LQAQLVDEEPICAEIGLWQHNQWMQEPICAEIDLCKHNW
jgi:hypothetical protein